MLEASSLTLAYDGAPVIEALDLSLPGNKVTAIIGPNGCGKSTLLKALARILPVHSGRVTLDDEDMAQLPPRALARRLAILPQAPRAPEGIRVADLVRRGRLPWRGLLSPWREEDRAACDGALSAVGMTELAHRDLAELSGGQRQRAWLALVLAQGTPWLLLDEPTTYLDLTHQMEVLGLLRRLNRQSGTAVVSVLHDLNLAARYSDHLVFLGKNGVIADGTPERVLTPEHLRAAFGLRARVMPDPVTGTPMVVPLDTLETEVPA